MKRFISVAVCLVMLVTALATPAFAAFTTTSYWSVHNEHNHDKVDTYTLGDLNDDGKVDTKDVLVVRKYITGEDVEINENGGDIQADGKVTTKDLLVLRKHLVGIEDISKYEESGIIDTFAIAGEDISTFCIVVPEGVTDTESVYGNAANLFRKFVVMAEGYNLTIDSTQQAEHAIRFIAVDEESEMGQTLEVENYIYEVRNGDLWIYSTRRGAIYAVYDIMEEYLGYRFYSNFNTHEYTDRYVDIPEGTYRFKNPALDFRHCSQSFMDINDGAHRYPRHLNGSQAGSKDLKWGTRTGPVFINAHSYGYYWKMGNGYVNWDTAGQYDEGASEAEIKASYILYKEKYDSGYQQNEFGWNPCFISDDDYEVIFRGLLETMRYTSTWNVFRDTNCMSFSICDSPYLCSCTECRFLSNSGTMEIFVWGQKEPDVIQCLGGGGAAQCTYLANRGAKDIQQYYEGRAASDEWYYDEDEGYDITYPYGMPIYDEYPGISLYTILYDHALPLDYESLPAQEDLHKNIRNNINMDYIPLDEHIIIMYCGTACNNHYVGSYECKGRLNVLGGDGDHDVDSLKAWGKVCHDVGAQMWYWYYPVSYGSLVCDAPNITNIYHDIKFLVEECYVNGVYYEGCYWQGYQFEHLKAHLAAEVMYSFEYDEDGNMTVMSEEEFHEEIKEYLYLYYGDGYEYVYEYLLRYEESSDAMDTHEKEQGRTTTCYINNHDRPGDMFSYYYWQDNYLEMRELLLKALELADTTAYAHQSLIYSDHDSCTFAYNNASQKERIEYLLLGCDTLGLSANCRPWWADANATEENKAIYAENYTWLYNYIKEADLAVYMDRRYKISETLDLDITPLHAFTGMPSWNAADNSETWGASDDMPGWGTGGVEI